MNNIYYSTLRPVSIGTYPKDGMVDFENYSSRLYIPAINREAWGVLYYSRELTREEMENYDLVPLPENLEN